MLTLLGAGLRTLVLQTPFPDKPAVIKTLHIPFQLRSLHLYNRAYHPTLLSTLLAASEGSLTSLHLSLSSSGLPYAGLLASFHLVAPSLRHLHLLNRLDDQLTSLLSLCTNLIELVCHPSINLAATLDSLPPVPPGGTLGLRHLEVEVDYNAMEVVRIISLRLFGPPQFGRGAPPVRERVEDGPLAKLQRLRIRGVEENELHVMGMGEWLWECRAAGVELELDEASAFGIGSGKGRRGLWVD